MNVEAMLERYAVSYFADKTAGGWFDADEQAKKLGPAGAGMTIGARAVGGMSVPLLNGRELVAAMIENVEECRQDARNCAERFLRAKRDGLLDMKVFKQQDDDVQDRWLACINVVRGDYQRAVSEMKHWQEYAEAASNGTMHVLKNNEGVGVELIRKLADMKTFEADKRLPPEQDIG